MDDAWLPPSAIEVEPPAADDREMLLATGQRALLLVGIVVVILALWGFASPTTSAIPETAPDVTTSQPHGAAVMSVSSDG